MDAAELTRFLGRCPPFDSLDHEQLAALAGVARFARYSRGEVVLDAFSVPAREVFVVLHGQVDLFNNAEFAGRADETVGPRGVFGFSAMLTERPVGPRATAATDASVAILPASAVTPAFASHGGARYLAHQVSATNRRPAELTPYVTVDELIVRDPLVVGSGTTVHEAATLMTRLDSPCAAVPLPEGEYGLITDALIRRCIAADGLLPQTTVDGVIDRNPPTVMVGASAAEALLQILDRNADFVLVTDRAGKPRGIIAPRDFIVSSAIAGISLHEQVRRATSVDELTRRARRLPAVLDDLLSRGLDAGRVITVYSAIIDTVVRRAIAMTFDRQPDLSADAFTWLALGSNGRREAVLSSDVDAAVAFRDSPTDAEIASYRAAFAEVTAIVDEAGLWHDGHGTTPENPQFSRTNASWRSAARDWMATPEKNDGAIMTSLLVDGRPIHGDPGLPEVTRVFGDLRGHPGTMRLLLHQMLSTKAKPHTLRGAIGWRPEVIDVKAQGVLPVVNIGRWAALSVGSAVLPTVERLRAAAGSEMLPDEQASILIEVFQMLQRLRLRYQLLQRQQGDAPSDRLQRDLVSPIDRSIISQAVREIAAVQRRMEKVTAYVSVDEWAARQV